MNNEAIRTFFTADSEAEHSIAAYIESIEDTIIMGLKVSCAYIGVDCRIHMGRKNGLCANGYKEENLDKQLGDVSDQLKVMSIFDVVLSYLAVTCFQKDLGIASSSSGLGVVTIINNLTGALN
jgi:hypothetical protein